LVRNRVLIETQGEHLLAVLRTGTVRRMLSAEGSQLRRGHELAARHGHPRRQWPASTTRRNAPSRLRNTRRSSLRGQPGAQDALSIVLALGREPGRHCELEGEDVDWTNGTVSFVRKKTGVPCWSTWAARR